MKRRAPALVLALVAASSCAHYNNARLDHIDPAHPGYRLPPTAPAHSPDPRDRIFVVITLSGGGTRAAAFAYGALEALRDLNVPVDGHDVSLLSEVDLISSVSGGSFASAYFAAFGPDAFFSDFPEAVLHRHIESAIGWRFVAPWNWPRLWSPYVSRTDLAASYYDKAIFGHRTYGELPDRPLIVLNATDLSAGAPFPFLQNTFDPLCSDLAALPLAEAVAASSAFPVAFPPLTIRNWSTTGDCGYRRPRAVDNAIAGGPEANAHDYERARERASFEDPERKFLHLSDGGIGDNLGLRGVLSGIVSGVPDVPIRQRIELDRIDKLVVIAVDAKPGGSTEKDRHVRVPNLFSVLGRAASAPMANYSTDSVEWLRSAIENDATQVADALARRETCKDWFPSGNERDECLRRFSAGEENLPHCFDYYGVHVQFENAVPEVKEKLKHIGTRLQLPKKDVALLIEEGRRQVAFSKELARLVRDLKDPGAFSCPSPPAD